MGENLDKIKKENFDNMKIGFLLELGFRQNSINEQINMFKDFLQENVEFLNVVDIHCLDAGLDNFSDLFLNFTDLIFKDVDFYEKHCIYHKDFY